MSRRRGRVKVAALVAIVALSLVTLGLALTPSARAYGPANWQLGFAGTFIGPKFGNSGFWGWCEFVGVSSGTDGDCHVATYLHIIHGFSLTCQTSIDVSRWTTAFSKLTNTTDFFITGGTVTVMPASATAACLQFAFGTNVSATGQFIHPFDTEFPAFPGHFSQHMVVPGGFAAEIEIQVTQIR